LDPPVALDGARADQAGALAVLRPPRYDGEVQPYGTAAPRLRAPALDGELLAVGGHGQAAPVGDRGVADAYAQASLDGAVGARGVVGLQTGHAALHAFGLTERRPYRPDRK